MRSPQAQPAAVYVQVRVIRSNHSFLNASIGSTWTALIAGTNAANKDVLSKTATAPARTVGSVGVTPNRKLRSTGVATIDPNNPITTPIAVRPNAEPRNKRRTL